VEVDAVRSGALPHVTMVMEEQCGMHTTQISTRTADPHQSQTTQTNELQTKHQTNVKQTNSPSLLSSTKRLLSSPVPVNSSLTKIPWCYQVSIAPSALC
jgi:hypothetical protein